MRASIAILILWVLTAGGPPAVFGQGTEDEEAAQAAAEAWLDLIDAEEYVQSWNEAAESFQDAVTTDQWVEQVANVRQQVGALQERAFDSAETATDPPNAPPGEYVILTYSGTFENMSNATETVATVKEEDGSWKVAGYFVQPA